MKTSVIGLTAIKPKGETNFVESQYSVPNYDMFISKDPQRGAALCTERKLNARECQSSISKTSKKVCGVHLAAHQGLKYYCDVYVLHNLTICAIA